MTHAKTMTTIRLDLPPVISCRADAEPVARILAARWAEVTGGTPEDHERQAMFSVCLAAVCGDDQVVVHVEGRRVQ